MLFIQFPEWITPRIVSWLPIHWYGLMYLIATLIVYKLVLVQLKDPRVAPSLQFSSEEVISLFFWIIIGLIVGARIFSAFLYDTSGAYLRKPWKIFWPFEQGFQFVGFQGLSYHGAFIGMFVFGVTYLILKKRSAKDIIDISDLITTSVPLGYTFGRIGNFINAELYGRITAAPWGIIFPNAEHVPTNHPAVQNIAEKIGMDITAQTTVNLPRHPSQLYEALLEGVLLWLVTWFVFRLRRPFRGFMIGVYMIGYSIARFISEYFRTPDAGIDFVIRLGPSDNPRWLLASLFNLTMGQILSILMIAAACVWLYIGKKIAANAAFAEEQPQSSHTQEAKKSTARNRDKRKRKKH